MKNTLNISCWRFIFCALWMLYSCNNTQNTDAAGTDTSLDTSIQTTNDNIETDLESNIEKHDFTGQEVIATYLSATSYAARSDFYFETEEGEEIMVMGNVFGEKPRVKLPDDLLEDIDTKNDEAEGPPQANPALIGHNFRLYFNDNGEVYKVIPAKN
jgi:hypothetical protein